MPSTESLPVPTVLLDTTKDVSDDYRPLVYNGKSISLQDILGADQEKQQAFLEEMKRNEGGEECRGGAQREPVVELVDFKQAGLEKQQDGGGEEEEEELEERVVVDHASAPDQKKTKKSVAFFHTALCLVFSLVWHLLNFWGSCTSNFARSCVALLRVMASAMWRVNAAAGVVLIKIFEVMWTVIATAAANVIVQAIGTLSLKVRFLLLGIFGLAVCFYPITIGVTFASMVYVVLKSTFYCVLGGTLCLATSFTSALGTNDPYISLGLATMLLIPMIGAKM